MAGRLHAGGIRGDLPALREHTQLFANSRSSPELTQLFANNGAFFPETTSGQLVFNADNFALTDSAAQQITTR